MTRGHLYKAIIGDSIELPCKVKDLGSYVLLWRRGTSVLTAANLMVTRDPRFKLVEGYNLQIANVKIQDAGDYICQIGDNESRDQVHTLEILGKYLTLTVDFLQQAERRDTISAVIVRSVPLRRWRLTVEARQSFASVAVASPLARRRLKHTNRIMTFSVPPTIRVVPQNRQITARKGSTVTLECKASGNPVPAIYWHKKVSKLLGDAFSGSSHLSESPTLLLERVDRHHAGVYQCTAHNGVREAVHVDIEVTVLCKYLLSSLRQQVGTALGTLPPGRVHHSLVQLDNVVHAGHGAGDQEKQSEATEGAIFRQPPPERTEIVRPPVHRVDHDRYPEGEDGIEDGPEQS
uniref:Ig-like domain-containing protein n=1 Tax=Anopheles epiroticus TaxID=199890 RepID=A0A182PI98_9DIPT